ncbi:MAG: galactokinase family protein [bacterium]
MSSRTDELKVSAPGRICLFGEHQDYLHLPVIPCAISLRIYIQDRRSRKDKEIHIDLPDIGSEKSFVIQDEVPYDEERDYFKSVLNILQREKLTFSTGFDCSVHGSIPINSGTSSSSALIVAWVNFMSRMSDQSAALSPERVAEYAHRAEVVEFSEPGGMMDHYASAVGGTLYLEFSPQLTVERLPADLKSFVLGDSGEPKDTKTILARVKNRVIDIVGLLSRQYEDFSLCDVDAEDIPKYSSELDKDQLTLLDGTVRNYRITREAREILKKKPLDHCRIGDLLNEHQRILRDVLKISTLKIDRMIEAALKAGAYGAKINGSGGGGCMFAYAPENTEAVARAVEDEGGRVYVVSVDRGVAVETI